MEGYFTLDIPRIDKENTNISDEVFNEIWNTERNLSYINKNNGTPIIEHELVNMIIGVEEIPEDMIHGRVISIKDKTATVIIKNKYYDKIIRVINEYNMRLSFDIYSLTDDNGHVIYTDKAYIPTATIVLTKKKGE